MPGIKRKEGVVGDEVKVFKKAKKDSSVSATKSQDYKKKDAVTKTKDYKKVAPGSGNDRKKDASQNGIPKDSNTSKDAHLKQKAVAKERKSAKPNADDITRAKKLWERLRRKSHVPKEERDTLVKELFEIITGRVKEFVFKHDSVRTIQCALKYANPEQRKLIATELKGEYKTLAMSRYAKFLVAKILVDADKETRNMIISEFYGHARRLINHPEASWILDDTYRQIATSAQRATLLREWYGPEFSIFKTDSTTAAPTADLADLLVDSPEKRKPILNSLQTLINQLVQKKMTAFTMLHDAMLQYSLAVGSPTDSEAGAEFLELLKGDEEGDLLKNLAFTKSGSRVVCRALAYTAAKDRKAILRTYKDDIATMAIDPNAQNVLLATFEVVDDTVMLSKLILPDLLFSKLTSSDERLDAILKLATHPVGRVTLLYAFGGARPAKWLVPESSATAQLMTEMHTLRTTTSKKDPTARRTELARALLTSSNNALLETIAQRTIPLVASSFGCQFIAEILLSADESTDDTARIAAMQAVAKLASGDPTDEAHMARSPHAGRMLKSLVFRGRLDAETKALVRTQQKPKFAELLCPCIKEFVVGWAAGQSSFVVVNLVEDEDFEGRDEVKETLKMHKGDLEKASKSGNKGAALLLGMI